MWKWIQSLEPSAATFVGSFSGATVGLVAILIGALFNSWLNRRRDDRLFVREREALAASLLGELISIILAVDDRRTILRIAASRNEESEAVAQKDREYPYAKRLALNEPVVFNASANKLGILGNDAAGEVSRIFSHYQLIRNLILVGIDEIENGRITGGEAGTARDHWFNEFQKDALEVSEKLSEISGEFHLFQRLKNDPLIFPKKPKFAVKGWHDNE